VLVDGLEEVPFHRRHPDRDAGRHRPVQPLPLVAVVVRHQHRRHPVRPEFGEMVQHPATAEIHQHRDPVGHQDVDVTSVLEQVYPVREPCHHSTSCG
jgi:hypothetical protein